MHLAMCETCPEVDELGSWRGGVEKGGGGGVPSSLIIRGKIVAESKQEARRLYEVLFMGLHANSDPSV